jgi:predicted Zn-ribbon and HTH transcriptional regulator
MAAQGYFPTSQSWVPGQWGVGAFIIAFLLCFILIGILVVIYMLIVKPDGTLTVTYEWRATSVEEKTCPRCAERVKAAALVCRFCGYEFRPEEIKKGIVNEGIHRGYHYVQWSDGTADLKLSSGQLRKVPTFDYLKGYVDAITR